LILLIALGYGSYRLLHRNAAPAAVALGASGLLEAAGDRADALKEYTRFLDLWKQADPNLPELTEARIAIARLSRSRRV
jgi:hypothetical protein